MPAAIDLTGHKYNRLTALRFFWRPTSKGREKMWVCLCDCGSETTVSVGALRSGSIASCGCLKREKMRAEKLTHGMRDTPEYAIWCAMKARCHNPNDRDFKYYGARGVRVCDTWRTSFEAFIADVGRRPDPTLSIERLDNAKGYEPGNVAWATKEAQARNRRPWGSVTRRGSLRKQAEP